MKPGRWAPRRSNVMKYVQIGILVSLVAIVGLLGGIYVQNNSQPEPTEPLTYDANSEDGPLPVQQAALTTSLSPEPVAVATRRPSPAPAPRYEPAPLPPAVPSPAPEAPVEIARAPAEPPPPIQAKPAPIAPLPTPAPPPVEKPLEPREVTLRAGLPITVRLDHTVSTERSQPGDTFTASLSEAIIEDGLIIADRGARLEGRVVDSRRASRINGNSYLALELTDLHTDDGQRISVNTRVFSAEGRGQTKKAAKRSASGAGIGAAIGAIAGGGKGAAIGAGIGGGSGAGSAAAQGAEAVIFEAETRIAFRLDSDLHVVENL